MSVEIKYSGNTIATLQVNKGALLMCEDMIMKDDITVINGEGTTVSIIDRSVPKQIAMLAEGQTATLKCAGKKMIGLIAISVSAYDPNAPKTVATFGFGANGTASHSDGTQYSVTEVSYEADEGNGYTLNLTNMSKVYYNSYDAKGNSCIKLGVSKKKGAFEFTVPDNVTKTIIYVAKYKGISGAISVNGGDTIKLTNNSTDGVYVPIEVDTSSNKTVALTTTASGYSVMIDKIEYIAPSSSSNPKPTAVDIKIGDNKADPTVFAGVETMYGFADGTKVVQMALEAKTDVDDKRLALTVDSSKQYLAIDFALEFTLLGNIYVWTVTDGGERVLAATILAEGGVATGNLANIVIKDSKGNDVTSQVLVALESGAAEKYTLYVYYNGANEVHIGCDDYDDEFGGNILYFANAVNGKEG